LTDEDPSIPQEAKQLIIDVLVQNLENLNEQVAFLTSAYTDFIRNNVSLCAETRFIPYTTPAPVTPSTTVA
jgi:hypothetical protein